MGKYKDYQPQEKQQLSGYVKLEQGNNKIRIVSEPFDFCNHYDDGMKKVFLCVGKKHNCPYCLKGIKPRPQYAVWAIDRADGEVKMFQYGTQIHNQLVELAKSEEYGFDDEMPYDITIVKKGEKLDTEYKVIPARANTELTQAEVNAYASKNTVESIIMSSKQKRIAELEVVQPDVSLPTINVEDTPDDDDIDIRDVPL